MRLTTTLMPSPVLDVLIPAFAPSPKLEAAIASVLQHTTVAFNLLVSVKKQSCAMNRNDLLLMSRAPFVAFLDDDVEVPRRSFTIRIMTASIIV